MFRKLIVSLLVAAILFSSIPIANAATETDPYYQKYGVTYEQLFRLYPEYLQHSPVDDLLDVVSDDYLAVIKSYSVHDNLIASWVAGINTGVSILGNELLSLLQLTDSAEERIREESVRRLMTNICDVVQPSSVDGMSSSITDFLSASTAFVSSNFSALKDTYGTGVDINKAILIQDLKEASWRITDDEIESLIGEMTGDLTKTFGKIDTGIEYWQMIVGVIELQELELDIIYRLKEALPRNDGLAADLQRLIDEIHQNIVIHAGQHFLTQKCIEIIEAAILAPSFDSFAMAFTKHIGAEVLKAVANWLYQDGSAEDIAETIYLYGYTDELKSAVANLKMNFWGKTANLETDIARFEFLYTAYLQAERLTAEGAANIAKEVELKMRLTNESKLFDTLSYDYYIEKCMQRLARDIADGKVAPVDQAETSGSSSIVLPEESRTFIKNKFSEIQKVYTPNNGTVFFKNVGGASGSFGFARFVFDKIFDRDLPNSVYSTRRFKYTTNLNIKEVGQLSGAASVTENAVKDLLSEALLGDIIQACGSSQHTMIVVEASNTGITVYDCNKDGDYKISQYTLSYEKFAKEYSQACSGSASGVTLYRAANYDTLYWDSTDLFFDESRNFILQENLLVKYIGAQPYVTIPDGITAIGEEAFCNNDYLLGVTFPSSVTSIDKRAFYDCDGLLFCNFSENLERVRDYAFESCDNLSCINLPDSVTSVGHSAFEACKLLSEIKLSNNLTTVGNAAFSGTAITEIFIPKSLVACDTAWGDGPFQCANLKTVTFEEGTTRITPELFAGCSGLEEIVIPETVTEIGASAFSECENLKSIIFEGDITTIEKGAFSHCESLSRITLPESLTTIGAGAFSSCGFSRITIPDGVTVIPGLAFANCEYLGWVTLPKNLEKLGTYAFSGCDLLQSVHIPKSLVECEGFPFSDCRNLKMVTFEEGTETVVKNLFMGCDGLETITIPNSVTTIEEKAFYYCWNLKTVKFGNNVTTISFDAFQGCPKLTGVALPENLNKMSSHAFAECVALTEIEIPDKLTHIPYKAFADCTSLKKVTLPSTLISMGDGAFSNTAITEIHIPKSLDHCEDHYGRGPFAQCANLKTVTFEDGTKKIADNLFKKCSGIEEITIPDTVTTIEEGAFDSCTNLKKVTIPRTVANIAENAFVGSADVTIYGYIGSTAETFATENNIPFVALDDSSDEHPTEHEPAAAWTTDGTYHWKVCSIEDCGEAIEETKAQHSATGSNIATCTVKAVCDVCVVSFGDYAAHNYTVQTKTEDTMKAEGNCRDAALYYFSCSVCGDIERSDSHTFAGEKVADAHVGGTSLVNVTPPDHKNQVSGYSGDTQCNGCGEIFEYGSPVEADEHTPAASWTTDGENHWKICGAEGCGVVIESTKGAHTSSSENVATCQSKAVCDTCSEPYGEVAGHDWATSWSSDVSGHWYICKANGCEETHAFATHTPDHDGEATEEYAIKCSVCSFVIAPQLVHVHAFDREVESEDYKALAATCEESATYFKSCKCGEKGEGTFKVGEPLGHKWSDETCVLPSTCSVCRATKGEPTGHTEGKLWVSDEHYHWHICTAKDCGAVIESSKALHSYTSAWRADEDSHWTDCICGAHGTVSAHVDANNNYRCDTCNANMGSPIFPGGGTSVVPEPPVETPSAPHVDTPPTTPTEPIVPSAKPAVTVPVLGGKDSITAEVSIEGTVATLGKIDLSELDDILGTDAGEVTIDFSVLGKELEAVKLPAAMVEKLAEVVNANASDTQRLEVCLADRTSIVIDPVALSQKLEQGKGDDLIISVKRAVTDILSSAQQQTIGNRTAFDITVSSNGVNISDLGGKITICVPYELRDGEHADGLSVFYVDEDGNMELCKTSYDGAKKMVSWEIVHLSVYMIAYETPDGNNADGYIEDNTSVDNVARGAGVGLWVGIALAALTATVVTLLIAVIRKKKTGTNN